MALVGLVFGGRSVEHEVSIVSARTVAKALADAGHTVLPLALAQDGSWVGAEASRAALAGGVKAIEPLGLPVVATVRHLLTAPCEVLFPITHGTWGEDGTLQGLFEMLDLAYVGAGVAASAVAMDKRLSKELHRAAGIPVGGFLGLRSRRDGPRVARRCSSGWPMRRCRSSSSPRSAARASASGRVESAGGSSPGAIDFAFGFDDSVLIERGVVGGRELEVAVAGYPRARSRAGDRRDRPRQRVLRLRGQVPERPRPAAGAGRGRYRDRRASARAGGRGLRGDRRHWHGASGLLPRRGRRRAAALRQRDQHASGVYPHLDVSPPVGAFRSFQRPTGGSTGARRDHAPRRPPPARHRHQAVPRRSGAARRRRPQLTPRRAQRKVTTSADRPRWSSSRRSSSASLRRPKVPTCTRCQVPSSEIWVSG